jgi:lipid II:glycine glycyltransferase (peptidoglycan interpeptide bridge formation enzyme)
MQTTDNLRITHDPKELDESAWSQFILKHDAGNVFQTPEMYSVFKNTERYEPVFTALLDENENILAIMLGARIEEPGRIAGKFSSRVVVYGGPIISEEGDEALLLQNILRAHNEQAGKKAIFTEIRHLSPRDELTPLFESVKYEYVDHLNIHIDLTPGIDELWKGLRKNRRRGVRKGRKSGLGFVELTQNNLDDVYRLMEQTYSQIRVPMPPKSLFESIMKNLQERDLARFFGANLNEELIGVGVFLTYKDVIYLWYNSHDWQYSKFGTTEYIFWSTIEWAVTNGFNLFDFGGAGRRGQHYGVRDFKSTMGGHEVELGRLVHTHSRWKSATSQAGYRVWRVLRKVRRPSTKT